MRHFPTTPFALSALVLGVASCSGANSDASGAASDLPSCSGASESVLKLEGDVGGATVHLEQSPAGGGFSQFQGGQFDTPLDVTINGMSLPVDPGDVQLHLKWAGDVVDGSSAAATGTVILPSSAPHGGETLCAGDGSQIFMPVNGDFLQFDLKGLQAESSCATPIAGRLRGCWASGNR